MSKRSTAQNKELEIVNSPVNLNGVGEDKVIHDLLSDKFVKGTNQEAAEIGMALRQLISGQAVMLQNQEEQSREIARIRSRMAEMDATAEKYEKDRDGFIQEVLDKADRIRTSNPDRAIVRGMNEFQDALTVAKAEANVDKMKFHENIRRMPKETVISPGVLETVMENGRPVNKIMAESIGIKDLRWVLPPGIPTEVPQIVAAALRDRRRSEEESRARESMLTKNLEQGEFNKQWAEINARYNSPTQ